MPEDKKKSRARRGTGCVFQKTKGGSWHIQYYGPHPKTGEWKCLKEYVGMPTRSEAQKTLSTRLSQVARGEAFEIGRSRPTVEKLYENLLTTVELDRSTRRGGRKTSDPQWRWAHLRPFFGHMLAVQVTPTLVERYAAKRLAEGSKPATVNRELATLRRMFNHGRQQGVVRSVPYIRMLKEDNVRTGFVEHDVFFRMTDEAAKEGPWLRAFVELAYRYGWRSGELTGLRVKQVDLIGKTIRLEPGTTKNGRGREVAMLGVVHQLLAALCEGKGPDDYVFTRQDGGQVRDFRAAWQNMCVRAGVPGSRFECRKCKLPMEAGVKYCREKGCDGDRRYAGLIVHDMRRSAARNMLASGMREKLVMDVGGWLTREVMYRYALPNLTEQRAALEKMERAFDPPTTSLTTKEGTTIQ